MEKRKVLERLEKAWMDFQESFEGLSESQLLVSGVTGAWSVRDILAHVTTWEEEALKHLPSILRGETPPRYSVMYGGIDAFNAQTTAQKKNDSLRDVLRQLTATHRKLLDFLETLPEEYFAGETRFRHRLRLDTYGHYPKHARAIQKWREAREPTNSGDFRLRLVS